jgi:hypothetical protein
MFNGDRGGRKLYWAILRHIPCIWLEGRRRSTEDFGQDVVTPSRESILNSEQWDRSSRSGQKRMRILGAWFTQGQVSRWGVNIFDFKRLHNRMPILSIILNTMFATSSQICYSGNLLCWLDIIDGLWCFVQQLLEFFIFLISLIYGFVICLTCNIMQIAVEYFSWYVKTLDLVFLRENI